MHQYNTRVYSIYTAKASLQASKQRLPNVIKV